MKTAWITDQHFGARSNSKIFLDNYEKFYSEVFFPTLEEQGIKNVVNLGDLWENRRELNAYTLQRTREMFFDELKRRGIEMYIIYGNHDVYYRDTNETNLIDFLGEQYDNIRVISEPCEVGFGKRLIGLMPWIHKNNLEASMRFLETTDAEIIGGHFEIQGFEMTKGHVNEHGFERSLFSRFSNVYSGHFHVRGKLGNIQYLSNPSQTSWADVGLEKGFHIMDNGDDFSMTPVDNPFRMFHETVWDEMLDPATFEGVYGRLHVPSFEGVNRAMLDLFVNNVQAISPGLQVLEATVDQDGVLVDLDEHGETINTAKLLSEYVSDAVGSKEGLDVNVLMSMVTDLYNDASARMVVE